uniref:Thioredoxin domain-containing protein n=1 Tax=Rhabditophanes sp. KR3021 TaxID=114890 RepID=A0AC35U163_9BILA
MLSRVIVRSNASLKSCQFISRFSTKKPDDPEIKIDFEDIKKHINKEDANVSQKPAEDPLFMGFKKQGEKESHERSSIFGWKTAGVTLGLGSILVGVLLYIRNQKMEEQEKQTKLMAGKARIGGEWELVNTDGKLEGSKDLLGSWVLMYFGFTHCPDICPDEIEKMISVVDTINEHNPEVSIKPVFISVDPARDTRERVKAYCSEFSPKLKGFTGTEEQTKKVAKTFRVYHSQGPKTADDDYIVDHTVIMYLMDPEGNFHDYYGQNKTANEIVNVIKLKVMKYELEQRKDKKWI